MSGPAQTNLQLYNELAACGWRDGDVVRVRDAYGLACELFSAMLRPSGKVFVSHLVGTASVLATIGEEPSVVVAGLLHAAYTLGEFGDGTRGMTPRKRQAVRAVVGGAVEQLVAAYTRLDWNPDELPRLVASAASFDAEQRALVVIRLANEIDDWSDAGLRYAPSTGAMYGTLDSLVTLSDLVGVPQLGQELRELGRVNAAADVPQPLVQAVAGSYVVPPRSSRTRLRVSARRFADGPRVARIRRTARSWARRVPLARSVHALATRSVAPASHAGGQGDPGAHG